MQGVDEGTWWIGRIQKMRRKAGGNSWGSLKQLVDVANKEANPGEKRVVVSSVQAIMHYYTRAPGHYKFIYDLTDSQWISLEAVITNVSMSFNSETQIYSLESSDTEYLNDFFKNKD